MIINNACQSFVVEVCAWKPRGSSGTLGSCAQLRVLIIWALCSGKFGRAVHMACINVSCESSVLIALTYIYKQSSFQKLQGRW
jgi:hypothetical protein